MSARRMDWLRLEQRLRQALREAVASKSYREGLVRLDEILADSTGRGNVLQEAEAVALCGGDRDRYRQIQDEEWAGR